MKMKPNIVLAGLSTPIQKVLERASRFKKVCFKALFTEIGASLEIESRAESLGMDIFDMSSLKHSEAALHLAALETDWFFNINSTIIYDRAVLEAPRKGALNMHPGLLPEYAGLHTHQWAIRNGETVFGSTLHWMERLVDRGPIAYEKRFPVSPKDTGLSLFIKCLNAGADLMDQTLAAIDEGLPLPRIDQDLTRRRLYRHRDALDGTINWDQPASRILDFIRAADYSPFQCPTYTPATRLGGDELLVRKARTGPPSAVEPGRVTGSSAEGLMVSTGNGGSIILTVVEFSGKGAMKGKRIQKELSGTLGNRLGTEIEDEGEM